MDYDKENWKPFPPANEEAATSLPLLKRRSSILKEMADGITFGHEGEQPLTDNTEVMARRKSKRVSFADTKTIKLFASNATCGTEWHDSYATAVSSSSSDSSAAVTTLDAGSDTSERPDFQLQQLQAPHSSQQQQHLLFKQVVYESYNSAVSTDAAKSEDDCDTIDNSITSNFLHQFRTSVPQQSAAVVTHETVCEGNGMDFTSTADDCFSEACAADNGLPGGQKTCDDSDMEFTCALGNVVPDMPVPDDQTCYATNMDLTRGASSLCSVLPSTVSSVEDTCHLADMEMTCAASNVRGVFCPVDPVVDDDDETRHLAAMELTCASSNIASILSSAKMSIDEHDTHEAEMEITCDHKEILKCNKSVDVYGNDINISMEMTSAANFKSILKPDCTSANVTQSCLLQDMELTCAASNIRSIVKTDSSGTSASPEAALKTQPNAAAHNTYNNEQTTNIGADDNPSAYADMELTCVTNNIASNVFTHSTFREEYSVKETSLSSGTAYDKTTRMDSRLVTAQNGIQELTYDALKEAASVTKSLMTSKIDDSCLVSSHPSTNFDDCHPVSSQLTDSTVYQNVCHKKFDNNSLACESKSQLDDSVVASAIQSSRESHSLASSKGRSSDSVLESCGGKVFIMSSKNDTECVSGKRLSECPSLLDNSQISKPSLSDIPKMSELSCFSVGSQVLKHSFLPDDIQMSKQTSFSNDSHVSKNSVLPDTSQISKHSVVLESSQASKESFVPDASQISKLPLIPHAIKMSRHLFLPDGNQAEMSDTVAIDHTSTAKEVNLFNSDEKDKTVKVKQELNCSNESHDFLSDVTVQLIDSDDSINSPEKLNEAASSTKPHVPQKHPQHQRELNRQSEQLSPTHQRINNCKTAIICVKNDVYTEMEDQPACSADVDNIATELSKSLINTDVSCSRLHQSNVDTDSIMIRNVSCNPADTTDCLLSISVSADVFDKDSNARRSACTSSKVTTSFTSMLRDTNKDDELFMIPTQEKLKSSDQHLPETNAVEEQLQQFKSTVQFAEVAREVMPATTTVNRIPDPPEKTVDEYPVTLNFEAQTAEKNSHTNNSEEVSGMTMITSDVDHNARTLTTTSLGEHSINVKQRGRQPSVCNTTVPTACCGCLPQDEVLIYSDKDHTVLLQRRGLDARLTLQHRRLVVMLNVTPPARDGHSTVKGARYEPTVQDLQRPMARLAASTFSASLSDCCESLRGLRLCCLAAMLPPLLHAYDASVGLLIELHRIRFKCAVEYQEDRVLLRLLGRGNNLLELTCALRADNAGGVPRYCLHPAATTILGCIRASSVEAAVREVSPGTQLLTRCLDAALAITE